MAIDSIVQSDKSLELYELAQDISSLLKVDLGSGTVPSEKAMVDQQNSLMKYRNYLVSVIIEKEIDPADNNLMLEEFLSQYGLELPFDIKKYIDEGDIVEIYSEDFVQIYRNSEFFKFCSYDIYTILSNPFDKLFRRDPEITEAIVKRAIACMGAAKGVEPAGVPPHLMQEHFARNSKVFKIHHKWCSPVLSKETGAVMGFFCSQRAELYSESNVVGIGISN